MPAPIVWRSFAIAIACFGLSYGAALQCPGSPIMPWWAFMSLLLAVLGLCMTIFAADKAGI